MIAKHEVREFKNEHKVFLGCYENVANVPHWHSEWELVYLEKGTIEAFVAEHLYELNEGYGLLIPGGYEHSLLTKIPSRSFILLFTADIVKPLLPAAHLRSPLLKSNYDFYGFFSDLKTELSQKPPFYTYEVGNRICDFFIRALRKEEIAADKEGELQSSPFMQLIEDIDGNYSDYSAERAASFLHMSPSYFSKYFHRKSGLVFSRYLNSVRVEKAVDLLRKEKGIKLVDCASRCGFDTIRNFNRVFKAVTGYPPSALPETYIFSASAIYYGDSHDYIGEDFDPTLASSTLLESWE